MKEYVTLDDFLNIFKSPSLNETFEVFYNKALVKSGIKLTKLSVTCSVKMSIMISSGVACL